MKVLVIDLLGSPAQEALLRSTVASVSEFADVTLAATTRYHEHHSLGLSVYQRLHLPEIGFDAARQYLVGPEQIMKLIEIRRHLVDHAYDHVIVLSYETTTFALLWNRKTPCWLINHSNLNELCHCGTRRLLFSRLTSPTKHIVFCEEFADMLRMKYNLLTEVIPYPATHRDRAPSPTASLMFEPPVTRVFAPSRHGCRKHGRQLRDLVFSRHDLQVIMRGDSEFVSRKLTIRKHFADYHEQIAQADVVLCAGEYHYRVSTVAFDALSCGKPILMWDGPFANSLRRQFPSLIKTISRIDQIPEVVAAIEPQAADFAAFQSVHHRGKLSERWRQLLGGSHRVSLSAFPAVSESSIRRAA